MNTPSLSVIMPVYNAEKFINHSVESVLAQTYKDFELIIVDDCSKDDSLEIAMSLAQKDERIKVIALEKNVGAGYARNEAVKNTSGRFLTFVDADDYIEPDLYENAMSVIEKDNLDWIHWGMKEEYYGSDGAHTFDRKVFLEDEVCLDKSDMYNAIVRLEDVNIFGYQCNSIYKTSIIKENNIFFEKAIVYEDFFFNLDFAKVASSMAILSQTGYHYKKQNEFSITRQYVPEYFPLCQKRVKELYDAFSSWGIEEKTINSTLSKIYLKYILSALMRNCDKKSGMTMKDRTKWIEKLYSDELFLKVCKDTPQEGKINKVLDALIDNKQTLALALAGRAVFFAKVKAPKLFLKLKSK